MKLRWLAMFMVVLALILLAGAVAAQGPEDDPAPREGGPHFPPDPDVQAAAPAVPPAPERLVRGQRPLQPPMPGPSIMGEAIVEGAVPLGLGGGAFDVDYFFDDMESGDANWTASGFWHIADATSNYPNAYNGDAAWWYGQEATGDYNIPSTPNSGSVETGPIQLPAGTEPAYLRFWSWEYTEWWFPVDTRKLYTSTNGTDWTMAWQGGADVGQWYEVLIDLSDLRGEEIYLRFEFDTVDGSNNGYRGWYIDDVAVGYDYIQLFPTSQTGYGEPGDWVGYPTWPPGQMWIENHTGVDTNFTLTVDSPWPDTFPAGSVWVNDGDRWWFGGDVQIPAGTNLGKYKDATLTFTSEATPTLSMSQTVRTWSGWIYHADHTFVDDGSGNSDGDGDGKLDPGEAIDLSVTLKNKLGRDAIQVDVGIWSNPGMNWWDDWERYGDIADGDTADSAGTYEFGVPDGIQPGSVVTFYLNINDRNGWWQDWFTATIDYSLNLERDMMLGGDPGETVVYDLELTNWTGSTSQFDQSVAGNTWNTTVTPGTTNAVPHSKSRPIQVEVKIPNSADEGDTDAVTVQSKGNGYSDSVVLTTTVLCQDRRTYTGSRSGSWSNYSNYSYWPEPIARGYISATTNYTGELTIQGYDGWTWRLIYQDSISGTRQVEFVAPVPYYQQVQVYINDGWTNLGWEYDYRFETCWTPLEIEFQPAGAAAPPGEQAIGCLQVRNNTGVDTPIKLSVSGNNWDTVIRPKETMTVPNGTTTPCSITVDIPKKADIGDQDVIEVMAQSVVSPSLTNSARYTTTAISQGWYQAYYQNYPTTLGPWDNEAYLDSVNSFEQWQLTDDRDPQWDVAVSAFARDRVPYAWSGGRNSTYNYWVNEVTFGARDPSGAVVVSNTLVADHSLASDEIYDYDAVIAVDPVHGNIGLAWVREERASPGDPWLYNVYVAVYDEDGMVIQPPTALTSNTHDEVEDYDPAIEAYRDGHFAVAWEHWVMTDSIYSVHYAVLDQEGDLTVAPFDMSPNVGDWDDWDPRLAQLLDGNMMVLWEGEVYDTGMEDAVFAVVDTGGTIVQPETVLTGYGLGTADGYAYGLAGVNLSSGEVVVAWTNGGRWPDQIEYAILDDTYTTVVSPTVMSNTLNMNDGNWDVSLVEDEDGHAVFTWEGGGQHIFYARVNAKGKVLVEPVVYRQTCNTNIDVHWKGYGNGGMEARPKVKIYLPLVFRSYPEAEPEPE